jgi:hypothetical protein
MYALLVLVAAFLVLPAHSTASFSAHSLDYLNVQIVFPDREVNLTLLVCTHPIPSPPPGATLIFKM